MQRFFMLGKVELASYACGIGPHVRMDFSLEERNISCCESNVCSRCW